MQRESAAPVHLGRHNRHIKFAYVHKLGPYAPAPRSQLALHNLARSVTERFNVTAPGDDCTEAGWRRLPATARPDRVPPHQRRLDCLRPAQLESAIRDSWSVGESGNRCLDSERSTVRCAAPTHRFALASVALSGSDPGRTRRLRPPTGLLNQGLSDRESQTVALRPRRRRLQRRHPNSAGS